MGNPVTFHQSFGNVHAAYRPNRRVRGANPKVERKPGTQPVNELPPGSPLKAGSEGHAVTRPVCLGLYANLEDSPTRPFGEQTLLFVDLVRLGQDKGVDVVVLTPGFRRSGEGWTYRVRDKSWQVARTRLPDVVLRRSGTFRMRFLPDVRNDLQWLRELGKLHSLPRICGNKWELYRVLRGEETLSGKLPVTTLADSAADVYREVLARKDVYVKPLNGAQGVQIYRLFINGNRMTATWQDRPFPVNLAQHAVFQTEVRERAFGSFQDFQKFWSSTKLKRCLVQDTVSLLRTGDERPFDFRWLVQRCGDWRVMARVARIGNPKSVTTNIHTGGQAVEARAALEKIGWKNPDATIAQIDEVALAVAKRLETRYGPYAEVGIDLALTTGGGITVFEANPTPGRRMLRSLSGDVREMSLQCLVEYAIKAVGIASKFT
ncbi:YheC/YheD family protein [Alicyclobacillus tolerans]|uniref:YheC/YheD family protein n=1 Tax=Alicyclobacillus tolerans TaxID=90970 RepID=UPI001F2C9CE1|nr:YheC/YheD family protein [Alicyclobacillus tolerans]MCF8564835.1 YheC/YheD family protein [Alicyclobacillus tolerans]